MKGFRLHITRVITLIIALQVINLGLFAHDFQMLINPAFGPKINIINSINEHIAEVVLYHNSAVPENNKHSQKDLQGHKHITFKLINISRPLPISDAQSEYHNKPTSLISNYNYLFCCDIYPPPPKS